MPPARPLPARRPRPTPSRAAVRALAAAGLVAPLVPLVLAACSDEGGELGPDARRADRGGPPALPDEAAARGLLYRNVSGRAEKPTILEANGAGVALVDLAEDGDLDVVFAQGLPELAAAARGPGADLEVYANDGTGRFARAAGPGLAGWWTGLASGDVDGDGDTDLVAGAYGDLVLLLQAEDGALAPTDPVAAGLMPSDEAAPGARLVPGAERPAGARAPLWTTSLALFDADRDGVLDLYAARYVELDPLDPPRGELGEGALAVPCWWKGHEVFCGPRGMPAQPDALLRGRGDGSFEDASARWLPEQEPAYALGVAPFDADLDGDTDVFVANDSMADRLFVNELGAAADAGGGFVDLALAAGVALDPDGMALAGMGVAIGDVDRDGRQDVAVTNFSDEPTQLFLGAPRGFTTATWRLGLAHLTRRQLSWGVHLEDFDGDGWLELFVANGHVYPQADEPGTGTRYGQPDSLFRLRPDRPAELVALAAPSALDPALGTRGSAVGDVDGDGAPDLVLAHIDAPAGLGMNRTGSASQRLLVRLRGPRAPETSTVTGDGPRAPRTPADGRGAVVVLVPRLPPGAPPEAEHALLGEAQTARGFQSASSEWLHFGLGASAGYTELTVLWPSGRRERLGPGRAGRRITVREGEGIVLEEDFR